MEDPTLREKLYVFKDRVEAGLKLAEALERLVSSSSLVLAIPAGGVPIGLKVAEKLGLELDLAIVRKVLYPWTTEAGFGAVAWDGRVILDQGAIEALGLPGKVVKAKVEEARRSVEARMARLRGGRPMPQIKGREVVLIDDGLASGFTMLTAVRAVKDKEAARVVIAAPTSSISAVELLLPEVDLLVALNVRGGPVYAVADAYVEWRDLSDDEVAEMLASFWSRSRAVEGDASCS
mgnify:CR=1 FL=1